MNIPVRCPFCHRPQPVELGAFVVHVVGAELRDGVVVGGSRCGGSLTAVEAQRIAPRVRG